MINIGTKIKYQIDEYNLVSDGFFEDLMKK